MLTDQEIHALFADVSESDSHKKDKPKPKRKEEQKSRPNKKKAKITFDPDIFLDDTKEQNETDDMINSPLNFFTNNDKSTFPPEFSNLVGRITFYLNSQIRYLMDDFINELILMVDTTPKEREMIDDFLNDVCDSIKNSFDFYEDESDKYSTLFTPESFDTYADRFYQTFIKCEEYLQHSYNTQRIKSLRKDVNNSYSKIKKDFKDYPELLETEINELWTSYNNYDNFLNTRKIQEKSQKNREILLNCKRIEQRILYDLYSKQIEFIKDEQAKYSQFLEINEFNKSITMDTLSEIISSLKENIANEKRNSSEELYKRGKIIQKLKNDLKIRREQYHFLQQNQMSIAFSSIKDDVSNSRFQNSFMNQNNSLLSMNNNNSYHHRNDSSFLHSQGIQSPKKHTKSRNSDDSFSKIQKTFNSLMKESNKNLENTSDFIESIEDEKMARLMRRSYYG